MLLGLDDYIVLALSEVLRGRRFDINDALLLGDAGIVILNSVVLVVIMYWYRLLVKSYLVVLNFDEFLAVLLFLVLTEALLTEKPQ